MNQLVKALIGAGVALSLATACSSTPHTGQHTTYEPSLTPRVKTALIEDPQTKAYQINVDTYQQTVKLSGFVDTDGARARATTVARGVEGVKSVDNDLTVKP